MINGKTKGLHIKYKPTLYSTKASKECEKNRCSDSLAKYPVTRIIANPRNIKAILVSIA